MAKTAAQAVQGVLKDLPRGSKIAAHIKASEGARKVSAAKSSARGAKFSRVATWMLWLPITKRQVILLGRIYSFQTSSDANGKPHVFSMSLAQIAQELNSERQNVRKDLEALCGRGFLVKRSCGRGKPAVYEVNEEACLDRALSEGWRP